MKLGDSVDVVPFVGEKYFQTLRKLQIRTVEDLLLHIPSRYEDFRYTTQIQNVKAGEVVTIVGQITSIQNIRTKKGKLIELAVLSDGENKINIIWFNQYYLANALPPGTEVSVSGKVSFWNRKLVIFSPSYEKLTFSGTKIHTGGLIPIYPETVGVSSKWLRSRINHVLKFVDKITQDYLDEGLRNKYQLTKLSQALKNIHLPQSPQDVETARLRLAFDELLKIQVENSLKRITWQKYTQSLPIKIYQDKLDKFTQKLPYELTPSQKRTLKELTSDLSKPYPMNRLLEGDVGSGKTIIAVILAYLTFLNGHQTLVMAPTQILANQHFETFGQLLFEYDVKINLVTAATSKEKDIKGDILIGTHALIHKTADFTKAALVVIDEQHRFGVKQRGRLAIKAVSQSQAPNILTMTATPIPRTIALTLYGDLDLSTLDEIPSGRQKVTTWIIPESKRKKAYLWLAGELVKNNSQAFVVCPLIEESQSDPLKEVKAVNLEIKKLKKIFPEFKIGLLHGQMKSKDKDKILTDFRDKKYNILVTTPVVEVGIDIPNASVMLIETADRYGLAQLHQLRGRVGRGSIKSYCLLFTKNKGKKAKLRLNTLTQTHSGRELAQMDLKIRGVGEIFGTRQHGQSELKIATWQDIDLFKKTKLLSREIINNQEKYKNILDYFKSKQISNN